MTVYKKIAEIQDEIGVLEKNADNPYYNSRYLTLDKLVDNLRPLLKKHNLFMTQLPQGEVLKTIVFDFDDESSLETNCQLLCPPHDPQKQGSAITYARRYSLGCIFQIQTEEDDDGNKTVSNPPKVQPQTKPEPDHVQKQLLDVPCKYCGGKMALSSKGNLYCTNKCWLKNQ